jgi:hypothetical protein
MPASRPKAALVVNYDTLVVAKGEIISRSPNTPVVGVFEV